MPLVIIGVIILAVLSAVFVLRALSPTVKKEVDQAVEGYMQKVHQRLEELNQEKFDQ